MDFDLLGALSYKYQFKLNKIQINVGTLQSHHRINK